MPIEKLGPNEKLPVGVALYDRTNSQQFRLGDSIDYNAGWPVLVQRSVRDPDALVKVLPVGVFESAFEDGFRGGIAGAVIQAHVGRGMGRRVQERTRARPR